MVFSLIGYCRSLISRRVAGLGIPSAASELRRAWARADPKKKWNKPPNNNSSSNRATHREKNIAAATVITVVVFSITPPHLRH
jgi:hypothetical protein